MCRLCRYPGSLNLLEPTQGPLQACVRIALPLVTKILDRYSSFVFYTANGDRKYHDKRLPGYNVPLPTRQQSLIFLVSIYLYNGRFLTSWGDGTEDNIVSWSSVGKMEWITDTKQRATNDAIHSQKLNRFSPYVRHSAIKLLQRATDINP